MDILSPHNMVLYSDSRFDLRGSSWAWRDTLPEVTTQFVPETYVPVILKRKAQRYIYAYSLNS